MECDDRQDQDWLQEQRTDEDDVVSEFGQKQICRMRFKPFLHFRTRVSQKDRSSTEQPITTHVGEVYGGDSQFRVHETVSGFSVAKDDETRLLSTTAACGSDAPFWPTL